MRSGRLARRVVPALALCAGSAVADPLPSPPPDPVTVLPPVVITVGQVDPAPATAQPKTPPAPPVVPALPPAPMPPLVPAKPADPAAKTEAGPKPRTVSEAPPAPGLPGTVVSTPTVTALPPGVLDGGIVGGPVAPSGDGIGYGWFRAEYLLWAMSGSRTPPLITTAPTGTTIGLFGNDPGTFVLFGNNTQLDQYRSGVRLSLGTWIDCTRTVGWEVSGFWLNRVDQGAIAGTYDGSAVIGSSVFLDAANGGLPTAIPISLPGLLAGTVHVNHVGRAVWGFETDGRVLLTAGPGWRLDGLIGYRSRSFNERLDIHNNIAPLFAPGSAVISADTVKTENDFQGAMLGVDFQAEAYGWELSVRPSVGLGRMATTVDRRGFTVGLFPPAPAIVALGGTYVLQTNLGDLRTHECVAVPELDVHLSRQLCSCLRVTVGYSVLYLPLIARAAEQIDPVVNANLLPVPVGGGPARPYPVLDRNAVWLQGFSAGLELRF